jgi:hypothetical protein
VLSLRLYDSLDELLDFSYLDRSLNSFAWAPGPEAADGYRKSFESISDSPFGDVQTISKFLQLQNAQYFEDSVIRKSELLLHLGSIWKKFFPELSLNEFNSAYTYFSEFRSVTLNIEAIREVISTLDEPIQNAILIFWKYMEEAGLIDEHAASSRLSQSYLEEEASEKNNYCFFGLHFVSPIQLDWLNSLSKRHNVVISFPRWAYEKSCHFDWPRWIPEENVVNPPEKEEKIGEVLVYSYVKNKMNQAINDISQSPSFDKVDIYSSQSTVEGEFINNIPYKDFYFKASFDLFGQGIHDFSIELKKSPDKTLGGLIEYIKNKIETFNKSETSFVQLKTYLLWNSVLQDAFELLPIFLGTENLKSEELVLDSFLLGLFEEIACLNAPRNNLSCWGTKPSGRVKSVAQNSKQNFEQSKIVHLDIHNFENESMGQDLPSSAMKVLHSLGPIKRGKLDQYIRFSHMLDILKSNNSILLVEDGSFQESVVFKELSAQFAEVTYWGNRHSNHKEIKNNLGLKKINIGKRKLLPFSATKIQTYIDCPQKFYFSVIEKFKNFPEYKKSLRFDQLGSLEHKIIELYLKNYECFNEKEHLKFTNEYFQSFLSESSIKLDFYHYEKYRQELVNYSRGGIEELLKLHKILNYSDRLFEAPLNNNKEEMIGSVDCVMSTDSSFGLVDFKRSSSGIPTKKDFLEYKKVQLWIYYKYFNLKEKKCDFLGHINLGQPEKSVYYVFNKALATSLKKSTEIHATIVSIENDDEEATLKFDSYINGMMEKIIDDKIFPPIPRNQAICLYCPVNNFCFSENDMEETV